MFGAHLAARWGYRAAVLTSAASEAEARAALPPNTELIVVPSGVSTTFRNTPGPPRRQRVTSIAAELTADALPESWRGARILFVAPVAGEVAADFVARAGTHACVGIGAQGWLRQIADDGTVGVVDASQTVIPAMATLADAIFLSDEDLAATPDADGVAAGWASGKTYVLVTHGAGGASLVGSDAASYVPAAPARVVDETGAGDVFATAYLLALAEGMAPRAAARLAEGAASLAVEGEGLAGIAPRAAAAARVQRDTRIIAVANQKGGVGKTTTTVNLAAALAAAGRAVLIVDLDPQRNATSSVGLRDAAERGTYDVLFDGTPIDELIVPMPGGFALLPASAELAGADVELVPQIARELRLRRALEPVAGEYDYVFIDCPPSLGLLTVNALAAADEVLVPVQCEYLALEGLGQLTGTVELVRRNLNERLRISSVLLTMFDRRTGLSQEVADEVRRHFPQAFETMIPRNVRLSEAPSFGKTVFEYDASSRGARAYRDLATELEARRAHERGRKPGGGV